MMSDNAVDKTVDLTVDKTHNASALLQIVDSLQHGHMMSPLG